MIDAREHSGASASAQGPGEADLDAANYNTRQVRASGKTWDAAVTALMFHPALRRTATGERI
jgi:hypothetical protein